MGAFTSPIIRQKAPTGYSVCSKRHRPCRACIGHHIMFNKTEALFAVEMFNHKIIIFKLYMKQL